MKGVWRRFALILLLVVLKNSAFCQSYSVSPMSSGWSFNIGYHSIDGSLSSNFSNLITLGLDKDILYDNLYFTGSVEIGGAQTKNSFLIKDKTWIEDDVATAAITRLNFGYNFETDRIRFIPNVGIGSTGLYSSGANDEGNDTEDRTKIKSTFTTNIGLTLDYKFSSNKRADRRRNVEKSFGFIRFKYNYNEPNFQNRFNRFDAVYHSFSIGIGRYSKLKPQTTLYRGCVFG